MGIFGAMPPETEDIAGSIERLPFVVHFARDENDVAKAVAIRRSAYARHVPELAARFAAPESSDLDGSSWVLVASAKLDGVPLGSMRFRTNRHQPLDLEQSVTLPQYLQGRLLAEATRLAVSQAAVGRVVKAMMMKAMFLHCETLGVDNIVVTARHPMDRLYTSLMFEDVCPEWGFVPMAHVGMIPHRVMACDVVATKRKWLETGHPWYPLFFRTRHPDLVMPAADTRQNREQLREEATAASLA